MKCKLLEAFFVSYQTLQDNSQVNMYRKKIRLWPWSYHLDPYGSRGYHMVNT